MLHDKAVPLPSRISIPYYIYDAEPGQRHLVVMEPSFLNEWVPSGWLLHHSIVSPAIGPTFLDLFLQSHRYAQMPITFTECCTWEGLESCVGHCCSEEDPEHVCTSIDYRPIHSLAKKNAQGIFKLRQPLLSWPFLILSSFVPFPFVNQSFIESLLLYMSSTSLFKWMGIVRGQTHRSWLWL